MKKRRKTMILSVLFWLFIAAGALWVAFTPTHKRAPVTASVKVEQSLEQSSMQTPPAREGAPVGDEKAQPQVASIAPLPPRDVRPHGGPPRIAIVIDDMGLDMKDSERAVALPPTITLSYMPYATRLKQQTHDALDAGHELLLHMPMEPIGRDNPGPGAMLVGLSEDELRQRFDTALGSFTGFDGVNNHMGSKFTADQAGMELVVAEMQSRHLFFLDSRTSAKSVGESVARERGLPAISRDVFLDDDITLKAITQQLAQTEKIARRKGYAVAIGHPHTLTLEALESWLPEAEKDGFVFVPLHDLVQSQ